jgi:hypothetical protein
MMLDSLLVLKRCLVVLCMGFKREHRMAQRLYRQQFSKASAISDTAKICAFLRPTKIPSGLHPKWLRSMTVGY